MKNPYLSVGFAKERGLGIQEYELIEILSPEETMKSEPPKGVRQRDPSFY